MWIIYLAVNTFNKKAYIGQTMHGLPQRKQEHIRTANSQKGGSVFHAAINKYGVDSFSWTILQSDIYTLVEANEAEKFWISEFNCIAPFGYNLTDGGGQCGFSEISRKRMSESAKGKTISEATRIKLSSALKGIPKTDEHITNAGNAKRGVKQRPEVIAARIGIKVSDETRRNMSEARTDKIKIYCVNNKTWYSSASECSKLLGIDKTGILRVCHGKQEACNGLLFSFCEKPLPLNFTNTGRNRAAVCCIETNQIFKSVKSAAANMGLHASAVSNVCAGKQSQTGGFTFRRATQKECESLGLQACNDKGYKNMQDNTICG